MSRSVVFKLKQWLNNLVTWWVIGLRCVTAEFTCMCQYQVRSLKSLKHHSSLLVRVKLTRHMVKVNKTPVYGTCMWGRMTVLRHTELLIPLCNFWGSTIERFDYCMHIAYSILTLTLINTSIIWSWLLLNTL